MVFSINITRMSDAQTSECLSNRQQSLEENRTMREELGKDYEGLCKEKCERVAKNLKEEMKCLTYFGGYQLQFPKKTQQASDKIAREKYMTTLGRIAELSNDPRLTGVADAISSIPDPDQASDIMELTPSARKGLVDLDGKTISWIELPQPQIDIPPELLERRHDVDKKIRKKADEEESNIRKKAYEKIDQYVDELSNPSATTVKNSLFSFRQKIERIRNVVLQAGAPGAHVRLPKRIGITLEEKEALKKSASEQNKPITIAEYKIKTVCDPLKFTPGASWKKYRQFAPMLEAFTPHPYDLTSTSKKIIKIFCLCILSPLLLPASLLYLIVGGPLWNRQTPSQQEIFDPTTNITQQTGNNHSFEQNSSYLDLDKQQYLYMKTEPLKAKESMII